MRKTFKTLLVIAFSSMGALIFVNIMAFWGGKAILLTRVGEVDVVIDGQHMKVPRFDLEMRSVPARLRDLQAFKLDESSMKMPVLLKMSTCECYVFWLSEDKIGVTRAGRFDDFLNLFGRWMVLSEVALNCTYDVRDDMKGLNADVVIKYDSSGCSYQCRFMCGGQMREVEFRLPFTMLKGRVPHERSQRVAPAESNAVERVDKLRKQRRAKHIDMATDYGRNNNVACSRDATSDDSCQRLGAVLPSGTSVQELAEAASDKNQVMDELLNQDQIPADYGMQMEALFRDKGQDVLTPDFAVQHIGLYAQALQRCGAYDSASAEAHTLRAALDEASTDMETIIAAAAFRALADMAAFDPLVDTRRLDARLAACAGDASAAPAARVMAAHLCGERRVAAARATLSSLADSSSTPTPLRLAARHALKAILSETAQ